jgi:hypothetical protein
MPEMNKSDEKDPGAGITRDIVRSLVHDLAELAQAQASLTKDMVRLLDLLNEERGRPPEEGSADSPAAASRASSARVPAHSAVKGVDPPATAPPTPVEAPAVPAVPADAVAEIKAGDPAARNVVPPTFVPEWTFAPSAPAHAAPPLAPLKPPAPLKTIEPVEYTVGPQKEDAEEEIVVEPAAEGAGDEAADLPGEGPEEMEAAEPPDATVLVLESGDARVGVLWDQVVQVGSLIATNIPARIDTERGPTDLVSLGLLLHGVSREEKYFVVLEQDRERAAVACERMLGLGPLNSASKDDGETRIQVLRVALLKTFAKGAQVGASKPFPTQPGGFVSPSEDEDRDRNGPLRALVAVRYLPARVAICRHLRGRGWQVGEAAGLEAANISLDLGRWDVFFLEVPGNGDVDATETTILKRVAERHIPIVRVGSRISGYPGQDGPAVMFPFAETELDAILRRIGGRSERK